VDIGAGSGILSVFAVLQGAKRPVHAVDINPQTEYQVNVNLANNGLPESAVEVIIGDASASEIRKQLPESADLVLVNIGGDEDIAMLPLVRELIRPGATVVLSGIVEWSLEKVLDAYTEAGFLLVDQKQSEEWVTLLLRKCERMDRE
jgi:ribosomal protein L11 methyltransferase